MVVISTALYLFFKYFVFFFTVHYFAGKGLQDLSPSNIWKWVMYRISGIGVGLYRVITFAFYTIVNLFRKPKAGEQNTLLVLGNMAVLTAGMLGLLCASGWVQSQVFGEIEVVIQLEDFTNKETIFSNIVGIMEVFKAYVATKDLGLFNAIGATAACALKYVLFYVVTYSVLFGYMEGYMHELHIISNATEGTGEPISTTNFEELYTLRQLPRRCVDCIKDWLDNLAVMGHLGYTSVLIIVFAVLLGISGVMVWRQNGVEFSALLGYLFDESGLKGSVTSFLVVVFINLVWQVCVCYLVPKVLPALLTPLCCADAFCQNDIARLRDKRCAWTAHYDYVAGTWYGLHELHLH